LFLIVVKSISTDGKSILPLIVVPKEIIIESWFDENIIGYEIVAVSLSGYTNEAICMVWLDHFIESHNCRPDRP
jgi:hypothetical protein